MVSGFSGAVKGLASRKWGLGEFGFGWLASVGWLMRIPYKWLCGFRISRVLSCFVQVAWILVVAAGLRCLRCWRSAGLETLTEARMGQKVAVVFERRTG